MLKKGLNVKRTWGGKEKLKNLIKKEKDTRIKERLQTVLWRLENESYTEICKRLNRDNNTVSNWIKRWNKDGYDGLIDKQRTGRPTVLNPDEQKQVLDRVNNLEDRTRITCKILCLQIKEDFSKELTDEAVRKFLHKHNLSWKKPKKADYRQNEELKQEFIDALKKRLPKYQKTQSFGT